MKILDVAMNIPTSSYLDQREQWPADGRHIMAHYDDESIVVYQAYRPSIGNHVVTHQKFGGEWSFDRMSWIKPNFLWMMYRSGWGKKPGQEVVIAVRLRRAGFDQFLEQAVHSSFVSEVYSSRADWKQRVSRSSVRLQWDPDHDPHGNKVQRRAIQLGLRRDALASYARDWLLGIEDVSEFVAEQYRHVQRRRLNLLQTPTERVYPVDDPAVVRHLGLAPRPD